MQVPALASTTRSSIGFAHAPVSGVLNRALGSVLSLGLVQAFAVGLVMHLLHQGATSSPRAACAGMSRHHVKGHNGTPFSRCVRAAAKLRQSRHAGDPAAIDPRAPSSNPTAGTTPDTPATA